MSLDMQRIERLNKYITTLQNGTHTGIEARELYMTYQQDLLAVTPQEAFELFTTRFKQGDSAASILEYLDKVINVFNQGLKKYPWQKPAAGSFLALLRSENDELVKKLDLISDKLQADSITNLRNFLLAAVSELLAFDDHYQKKENILFPYMEKMNDRYEGVAIMWSLHDEARACLKQTIAALTDGPTAIYDESELGILIGKLFFAMHGLVQKEELILFPTASQLFNDIELLQMLSQSYDYSFPFVDLESIPDKQTVLTMLQEKGAKVITNQINKHDFNNFMIHSETGDITSQQALLILSALPVDISFVDENNKLRFFSRPKDRIFPRSPAAIGRDVKNCHPPESVHVVEEIIEAFRRGEQDQASFWIEIKGRFILIQYFALRDQTNQYRGVLEVSQDISDIRKLQGQRRLLQWDVEDENS